MSDEEGAEQPVSDQQASDQPAANGLRLPGAGASQARLQHRHLRSAIEFAVDAARRLPPGRVPDAFRRNSGQRQVAGSSLGPLRRAIEADPEFRELIADELLERLEELGGTDDTPVDAIGSLWLLRPTGWSDAVSTLLEIERQRSEIESLQADLRREQRRRAGAEGHLARERNERERWQRLHSTQSEQIEALTAQIEDTDGILAGLRAEVAELRSSARHAADREAAARRRLEQLQTELEQARLDRERVGRTEAGSSHTVSTVPGANEMSAVDTAAIDSASINSASIDSVPIDSVPIDVEALAEAAAQLEDLAERVRSLINPSTPESTDTPSVDQSTRPSSRVVPGKSRTGASDDRPRPQRRRALTMPSGVLGESRKGSEYLLSSSSVVIVDGYNVTKTNWAHLDLEVQRERLIDELEALANRRRNEVVVVFDGADQFGTATRRRRGVRVVFSPLGVLADDVIRREVSELDSSRSITVVTNDRAIRNDVSRCGANLMRSEALLEVLGV